MDLIASFSPDPLPLAADFTHDPWRRTPAVALDWSWQGTPAPPELDTTARVLWTPTQLWVGFECRFTELDVDSPSDPGIERHGLWERDVCEAFVQSPREPDADSYKEFEVAPTGQWCDLAIRRPRVDVDWRWQSGMRTAATIDAAAGTWRAVMMVPFSAFGLTPRPGDCWRANLFRVSRLHGTRHYLAFAPTGTPAADFHVPERFVPLRFAA